VFLAAAEALKSLDPDTFKGYELFLLQNMADQRYDGWVRLSGSKEQELIIFMELRATRRFRWFKARSFRIALNAFAPPRALDALVRLLKDGTGFDEWNRQVHDVKKQLEYDWAVGMLAAEIGYPVTSHFPGSRIRVG
jgi:hypothetical protein